MTIGGSGKQDPNSRLIGIVNEKGDFEVRDLQNLLNITVQSLPLSLGTHSSDDTRPPSYGVHSMVCDQTEAGFRPECESIQASTTELLKQKISNSG